MHCLYFTHARLSIIKNAQKFSTQARCQTRDLDKGMTTAPIEIAQDELLDRVDGAYATADALRALTFGGRLLPGAEVATIAILIDRLRDELWGLRRDLGR